MGSYYERETHFSITSWEEFPVAADNVPPKKEKSQPATTSQVEMRATHEAEAPNIFEILSAGGSWMIGASCSPEDAEYFFSPSEHREPEVVKEQREKIAKQICHACEVRSECLEEALALGHGTEGVWGGFNEKERNKLMRIYTKKSA